jgi:hypothetical protein
VNDAGAGTAPNFSNLFMYYHERKDSLNPQLLALKKKKNHQTSHPWARPDQSVRQLWACPKIIKPPILGRAQINLSGNFGTISTLHLDFPPPPHIAWGSLLLTVSTAGPHSPPLIKASRDTHTPPPIWGMVASVCGLWPQCGHLETTQAVTLKSGSSMTLLQFLNHPGCGENRIRKFSCFSVRVGACCTGLPAGLPIKENPGEPCYQSAASDGHRHTPRGHNLNYTIWTLYAESVSSHQAPFFINQASLDAP